MRVRFSLAALLLCLAALVYPAASGAATPLLQRCAKSPASTCATKPLGSGTYKLLEMDGAHNATYRATVSAPPGGQHTTMLRVYTTNVGCTPTSYYDGFGLYPGASHDIAGGIAPSKALCVTITAGAAIVSISPGDIIAQQTWQSQAQRTRRLSCHVDATRLRCAAAALTSGKYTILRATEPIQVGFAFIGGTHMPGPNGAVATHVDLSRKAGEIHLFQTPYKTCSDTGPRIAPLVDQTFHDGGQLPLNTEIDPGYTLCLGIVGTITLVTP